MTLQERIKAWREHRDLSVADMARGVGVAWESAYEWERESTPKNENLEALVDFFGLTMEQFYGPLPKLQRRRARA